MNGLDQIAQVVIVGLAVWRLASLLVTEDGPWHIFAKLRAAVGQGEVEEEWGFFAEVLGCVWCLAIWLAPLVWLGYEWRWWIAAVPAAAAIAIVVEEKGRR